MSNGPYLGTCIVRVLPPGASGHPDFRPCKRGDGGGVRFQIGARKYCKRGHELTPENTLIQRTPPGRRCKTCDYESRRLRRIKLAEAANANQDMI